MKKLLITGGLGLLGEAANYFYNKYEVIIFDKPRPEMTQYFLRQPLKLINRNQGIESIFEANPDFILHLGAKSNTDLEDPNLAYFTNTDFTNKLIKYAHENNKKLIYASSAATYGDGSNGFEDSHSYNELSRLKPLNLYGWSKHNSDLFFADYISSNPSIKNIVGLKFFNVYGRNELHKKHMASVISQMIPKIKNNEQIILFKHYYKNQYCEAERDFIYSGDICRILEILLDIDFECSIYNIGSGVQTNFLN